jgi:hypothetical protein
LLRRVLAAAKRKKAIDQYSFLVFVFFLVCVVFVVVHDVVAKVALTENGSTTLPLITDHTTHGVCLNEKSRVRYAVSSFVGRSCRQQKRWWMGAYLDLIVGLVDSIKQTVSE